MKKKYLFIIILFLSISASALEIPQLNGYINDFTSMLTPADKSSIETKITILEKNNATQIVILTIPTLESDILEEFSLKVVDQWVQSQKKIYNGVLILVVKNDRKIRIEISKGLETKLTDTILKRIINANIIPKFKQGNFSGGIVAGVDEIISIVKGEVIFTSSVVSTNNILNINLLDITYIESYTSFGLIAPKNPDYYLAIVTMEIENISGKELNNFSPVHGCKVQDEDNYIYKAETMIDKENLLPNLSTYNIKHKIKGTLLFGIPKGKKISGLIWDNFPRPTAIVLKIGSK